VLVVSGTRGFLPIAFAMGVASLLVWFGAMRTIPVPGEDGDDYEDYDEYDDYDAEREGGYDERPRGDYAQDGRSRNRRGAGDGLPDPAAAGMPLSAPIPPGQSGPRPSGPPGPPGPVGPFGGRPGPYAEQFPPPSPMGSEIPAGAYGQITVYTLLDGREGAFDRLSREAVRAAQQGEPGTLIYACHEVVGAPTQRIFYQLFRDQAAYEEHQRRPYVRQFLTDSRSHVIATNVIELRLDTAKVGSTAPPPGPELQMGRPWGAQ
jgi:quinol monooxygenase YgiN